MILTPSPLAGADFGKADRRERRLCENPAGVQESACAISETECKGYEPPKSKTEGWGEGSIKRPFNLTDSQQIPFFLVRYKKPICAHVQITTKLNRKTVNSSQIKRFARQTYRFLIMFRKVVILTCRDNLRLPLIRGNTSAFG